MNEFSIEGAGDRKFLTCAQTANLSRFGSHKPCSQGLALIPARGGLGMTLQGNFVGWDKQCDQWLPQNFKRSIYCRILFDF